MAKRKGRIRQTRTAWQKTFDSHPQFIQPFSWSDRSPEFLHVSIALIDHDYDSVKADFYRIGEYVNTNHKLTKKFHFNLSHSLKLIKEDRSILDEILKTTFKKAFEHILVFYGELINIELGYNIECNSRIFIQGFRQILKGRSETAILCKYLMLQYEHHGRRDVLGIFSLNTTEEIIENTSTVMSCFPPSIGMSENLDIEFCRDIWMFNYHESPLIPMPDSSQIEEERFKEMKIEEFAQEFKQLYGEFKNLSLLAIYEKAIAEINMGFISRICNLSLDIVDLEKLHKGEIAELVFRTVLENYIVGSWLMKRKDISLHKRFRDFSTGRERFFGEYIQAQAVNDVMREDAKRMVKDAIDKAGVNEIDVASERGDIFDLNIAQMAEEVWGKDNHFYLSYKRESEITHGQWRAMAKYHLALSHNPMHNGLFWYNENPNRFAGLVPSFMALTMSTEFLLQILGDIESNEVQGLKEKIENLHDRLWEGWMFYYNKYILPNGFIDDTSQVINKGA